MVDNVNIRMHLTILPTKLNIASISGSQTSLLIHPLVSQFLYTNRDEDSFFSITKTEHEISLVIEDQHLQSIIQFANDNNLNACIDKWPQNWIALRTDLGSSGGDNNGSVVNSLAQPLSDANITIFYVSTYSSDYCLVEEHNVERALKVLRNEFKVLIEGEELIKTMTQEGPKESFTIQTKSEDTKHRKLFFYDTELHLARISSENISQLAVFLLGGFFFDTCKTATIISFIQIEGEVSLMGDVKFFQTIKPNVVSYLSLYSESWRVFSIGDQPLGYSESGIVHSISAPLAERETSIFYMSTFRTDYCLVTSSDAENSLSILKQHFTVEHKRDSD